MDVIHLLSNADFTVYDYSQVLVPSGTVTINGESIITTTDIILPIGVNSTGSTSGTLYLIGNKKPEQLLSLMEDGNYNIKG